jgi:hypothetical protein
VITLRQLYFRQASNCYFASLALNLVPGLVVGARQLYKLFFSDPNDWTAALLLCTLLILALLLAVGMALRTGQAWATGLFGCYLVGMTLLVAWGLPMLLDTSWEERGWFLSKIVVLAFGWKGAQLLYKAYQRRQPR